MALGQHLIKKHSAVVESFYNATKLDADLEAELQLEDRQFEETKTRRACQWQRAVTLVATRKAAAAAAAADADVPDAPQPMDQE